MKTIYKYTLDAHSQTVWLPAGATILTVQSQRGVPCMWVMLNNTNCVEARHFTVYGTGDSLPDDAGDYVGTFQEENGAFIWHVFETTRLVRP
jgi:hypothetical protein